MAKTSSEVRIGFNEGSNTLVCVPGFEESHASCLTYIAANTPRSANVVLVSYRFTAEEVIDRWYALRDESSPSPRIVDVREDGTSARPSCPDYENVDRDITVVPADDFVEIGSAIRDTLSTAERNRSTVVCFDSITHLLAHGNFETTFRFLHVAVTQMQLADVSAYFCLDPTAHEPGVIDTLQQLFDEEVVLNHQGPTRSPSS